jgi:hypothetical protein
VLSFGIGVTAIRVATDAGSVWVTRDRYQGTPKITTGRAPILPVDEVPPRGTMDWRQAGFGSPGDAGLELNLLREEPQLARLDGYSLWSRRRAVEKQLAQETGERTVEAVHLEQELRRIDELMEARRRARDVRAKVFRKANGFVAITHDEYQELMDSDSDPVRLPGNYEMRKDVLRQQTQERDGEVRIVPELREGEDAPMYRSDMLTHDERIAALRKIRPDLYPEPVSA